MNKIIITVLVAIFLTLVAAFVTERNTSVAIIDLDKVANEIGRSDIMTTEIQNFVTAEEVKLTEYRDEIASKIKNLKEEMGQNPSREQSQQFLLAARNANNEIQKRIALVQQQRDLLKVKLVRDFRNEINPIIRHIANEHQFSIVEVMSPSHLYIDPKINISDKVVDELLQLKINNTQENSSVDESSAVNE